jgi:hypothetical protein
VAFPSTKQAMFNKIGIVISTASGAGASKVTKALEQQMFWFGISKIIKYSKRVNASSWEAVPNKIKNLIIKDTSKFAMRVEAKVGKVSPNFSLKFMFI